MVRGILRSLWIENLLFDCSRRIEYSIQDLVQEKMIYTN